MIWKIPVRWDMMSTMDVEAYTLEDAIERAGYMCNDVGDPFSLTDKEMDSMIEGSFEVDFWGGGSAVEYIRKTYNDDNPDLDVESYPELRMYENYHRSIGPDASESSTESFPEVLKVVFSVDKAELCCEVYVPVDRKYEDYALGLFFKEHPNIGYGKVKSCEWR